MLQRSAVTIRWQWRGCPHVTPPSRSERKKESSCQTSAPDRQRRHRRAKVPPQPRTTTAKKSASSQRFANARRPSNRPHGGAPARNRTYGIVAIALVVVIVAVLVIVKVAGGGSGSGTVDQASPPAGTPIPAATLAKLQSVPISTLAAAPTSGIVTSPQSVNGPALMADGKPELLFIGAEYCPHCAAERWPLYVALSKFGTFSPQPGRIHSANEDGDVPTLTFYGTTYSSPYFTFTPVEVYHEQATGQRLRASTDADPGEATLWEDTNGGTFPFVDFGGKKVLPSAQYLFTPLENLPFSTWRPRWATTRPDRGEHRRQRRPADQDDLRLAFQPQARRRVSAVHGG